MEFTMPAQVLNTFSKSITYQVFDPNNREHMVAFTCLVFNGRQHPTLRFQLELPHLDIMSMMLKKVAQVHIDQDPGLAVEAVAALAKTGAKKVESIAS